MNRDVRYVRRIAVMLALTWLAGCQRTPDLPAPPQPDLTEAYSEVKDFLTKKRAAVLATPTSAMAWGEYAMALDAHEFAAESIVCYRSAVLLESDDLCRKYLLALKLRSAAPAEAEPLLAEIAKSDAATTAMLLTYADVLLESGQSDAATKCLATAALAEPSHPAVLVRQADLAFRDGNSDIAKKILDSIPQDFVETVRLRTRMAGAGDAVSGAVQSAGVRLPSVSETIVDRCRTALFGYRRDPLWLGKLAADDAKRGDALALMTLEGLVRKHPELVGNRIQLAMIISSRGDIDDALQIVADGMESGGKDTRLFAAQGSLAILNSDWAMAEKTLRQLLQIAPAHKAAWTDLGFVYEQLSRPADALKAYDMVLTLDPHDAAVTKRRADLRQRYPGLAQ